MYLMIQNPGVCPVEGFTVLGLSSSRGKESAIGQFGSGTKHATNLLLRNSLGPQIFCGLRRLHFFTKPKKMEDGLTETDYNGVFLNDDGDIKDLGYALEYGEIDWQDLTMALREYVCNAIDRTVAEFGTHKHKDLVVDVTGTPAPRDGCTRIYIPWSKEIQEFVNELPVRFLHFFGDGNSINVPLINRTKEGKARVYRKGVFIREMSRESTFDYNFNEEVKIDEARNLSEYGVRQVAVKYVLMHATVPELSKMFRQIMKARVTFEASFNSYDTGDILTVDVCEKIRVAWADASDGGIMIKSDMGLIADQCRRKGHHIAIMPSDGWFEILKKCAVPTWISILSQDESEGIDICVATPDVKEVLEECWNRLWGCGLIPSYNEKPAIASFNMAPTDGEESIFGMCRRGKILINMSIAQGKCEHLYSTMLEELAHYITKSGDTSRDLQNFAFTAAVKFGGFCDD